MLKLLAALDDTKLVMLDMGVYLALIKSSERDIDHIFQTLSSSSIQNVF